MTRATFAQLLATAGPALVAASPAAAQFMAERPAIVAPPLAQTPVAPIPTTPVAQTPDQPAAAPDPAAVPDPAPGTATGEPAPSDAAPAPVSDVAADPNVPAAAPATEAAPDPTALVPAAPPAKRGSDTIIDGVVGLMTKNGTAPNPQADSMAQILRGVIDSTRKKKK